MTPFNLKGVFIMKVESRFITIPTSNDDITKILYDLFIIPRQKAIYWSKKTSQTPNLKIGYPGQHLVSLITGIEGEKSGARGNDLLDGSEIKSCSRIDQMDKCKECNNPVLRIESHCSKCNSTKINRMRDSKWLFTIRSESDLAVFKNEVKRVILVLGDYPNFEENDFETLNIQMFEIWCQSERSYLFYQILENYYYNIYLEHKQKNPNKTPAPKNFWPDSYQFYLCNPIKTFSATIYNSTTNPSINIDLFITPEADRSLLKSMDLPVSKLNKLEIQNLIDTIPTDILKSNLPINSPLHSSDNNEVIMKECIYLNEESKKYLKLREDTIFTISPYSRRSN